MEYLPSSQPDVSHVSPGASAAAASVLSVSAMQWALLFGSSINRPKEIITIGFRSRKDGPLLSCEDLKPPHAAPAEQGASASAAQNVRPAPPSSVPLPTRPSSSLPPAACAPQQLRRVLRSLLLAHNEVPEWSAPAGGCLTQKLSGAEEGFRRQELAYRSMTSQFSPRSLTQAVYSHASS